MGNGDINIIYKAGDKGKAVVFSEFFKLCGFYVIESIDEPYKSCPEAAGYYPEKEIRIGDLNWHGFIRRPKGYIGILKQAIFEICREDRECREELETLSVVYAENDLVHQNLLERYLYHATHDRQEACRKSFIKAYTALKKLENTEEEYRIKNHFQYFKITCQEKINFLSLQMKEEKRYDSQEMIYQTLKINKRNPLFWQSYILAGIIADGDKEYGAYGAEYFRAALGYVRPADAYIYYRIGRYYEKMGKVIVRTAAEDSSIFLEKALKNYRKACEISPYYYRSLYKIAFLEFAKGNAEEAIRYYRNVCRVIEGYNAAAEDGKFDLTPMDLEYLFKSYKKLFDIYDVWLDQKYDARILLEKLCGLEEIMNRNVFLGLFFPPRKVEKEEQALSKHLDLTYFKKRKEDWRG